MARMTLSVLDERSEEQPADEGREDDREQELELDLADRFADELGAVVGDADGHVGRQGLPIGVERLAHLLGHGHGVGAALLLDADALGRAAVDPGDAPDVLEAVLDHGDVARDRSDCRSTSRTTIFRRVSRSIASPRTRTLISRPGVSSRPAGSSTCSRWRAPMTSWTVRLFSSRRAASSQMRTFRSSVPMREISPMPGIVWSFSLRP